MSDGTEPTESGTSDAARERTRAFKSAAPQRDGSEPPSHFLLEEIYPNASNLFADYSISKINDSDTIVVLDTNTLLVPYHIKQDDLSALSDVYAKLAKEKRLFLPARSAREFIKHRDSKLADMMKAMNDQKSRLQIPNKRLSPLLEGVVGHNLLVESQEKLADSRRSYDDQLSKMIDIIRRWRGNDPITALYRKLFDSKNIIEVTESKEELINEWDHRRLNQIPPGYKDAAKEDEGIGDYLIWKSILKIGSDLKKDLIFVTGEEKSDWYVRSNGEAVYPRPELIDEFRRASGGRNLSLMSLAGLLTEMHVGAEVVQEIKSAEEESKEPAATRYQYLYSLAELRATIKAIFPDRERGSTESLSELRNEIIISGISSLEDLTKILEKYKDVAEDEESISHKEIYFNDVGITRRSLIIYDPRFKELLERNSIDKRRMVRHGGRNTDSPSSEP